MPRPTPQQARAELARRELARRGISVPSASASPAAPRFDSIAATEQKIAQRPSAVMGLRENPLEALMGILTGGFERGPGAVAQQLFPAAAEQVESIPANIGLGIQQRQPIPQVLSNVLKGVIGERPAQLGDIPRAAGVPEPISAGIGLLATAGIGGRPSARVASELAGTATRAVAAPLRPVAQLPGPIQFLKGNPKRISKAEQLGHRAIQSLRRGGSRHEKFFDRLHTLAEEAWKPMDDLARSIDGPITVDEVVEAANARFANDPIRANEVSMILKGFAEGRKELLAPELVDISNQIGQRMPKGVLRGATARNQLQQYKSDARSVVADILEAHAPESMRGNVAIAKQNWSVYKADQDRLFRLFQPGAAQNAETKVGISFLKRVAEGKLTPSEQEFLAKIQQQFPEIAAEFSGVTKQLSRALGIGSFGKTVGREAAKGAALVGGGALLARLLGIGR